jgi:hypothetical protein
LEKLYNFDLSLQNDISALKEKVSILSKALDSDTLMSLLEGFMKALNELNEKLATRDECITGISGGK